MVNKATRVLIAEDDKNTLKFLKNVMMSQGFKVFSAVDGSEAIDLLKRFQFDIVITDWLMPKTDGLHLVKYIRKELKQPPLVIMLTALTSEKSKELALESGADEFISKPVESRQIIEIIDNILARSSQKTIKTKKIEIDSSDIIPPFIGVVIAASTGGPPVLIDIFSKTPLNHHAAYYIVQHGPAWMFDSFVKRLQIETDMPIKVGKDGESSKPGTIYLAPGDIHMVIDEEYKIRLWDGPKENYIIPAADPLFRSAAKVFGRYCVAAVLTGLGKDGTDGAAHIAAAKGKVVIQDPENAAAPSMPTNAINSGIKYVKSAEKDLAHTIHTYVYSLSSNLNSKK